MKQFKLSTIKTKRFNKLSKDILSILSNDCWLAGGAIRSLINSETPSDYDLFFRNKVCSQIVTEFLIDKGYTVVFVCPIGSLITLMKGKIKVQLILSKFYNGPLELIDSFDFTCTVACINNEKLYIHDLFIKDVKKKYLRLNKLTYPSSTINRLIKYKVKGYYTADIIRDIVLKIWDRDDEIIDMNFLYMD